MKLVETFPTTATLGVSSAAISPDGKSLVDGGYASGTSQQGNNIGILEIWNVASGKLVDSPATTTSQISSISISPDGKSFVDVGDPPLNALHGLIELWSLPSGNPIGTLNADVIGLNAVCFSVDGKQLFVGCDLGSVEIWKVASRTLTSTLHTNLFQTCESLGFSPDGKILGVGGKTSGGSITLLDAQTGKEERIISTGTNLAASVSFSPDNKSVAGCGAVTNPDKGVLELWNYTTGKLAASFPTTAMGLSATEFSPDGKTLADVGYGHGGGVVETWDVVNQMKVRSFPTAATWNFGVAFSADGTMIATGGSVSDSTTYGTSGVVEIWSASTGMLIANLATSPTSVSHLSFSPDGKLLLVGGAEQPNAGGAQSAVSEVWVVAKGTLKNKLTLSDHTQYLNALFFSKDGKTIFAGTDLDLEAFSASTFKQLATYTDGGVTTATLSLNGKSLAMNSYFGWLGMCPTPGFGGQ